jgi:hypothetical protein
MKRESYFREVNLQEVNPGDDFLEVDIPGDVNLMEFPHSILVNSSSFTTFQAKRMDSISSYKTTSLCVPMFYVSMCSAVLLGLNTAFGKFLTS